MRQSVQGGQSNQYHSPHLPQNAQSDVSIVSQHSEFQQSPNIKPPQGPQGLNSIHGPSITGHSMQFQQNSLGSQNAQFQGQILPVSRQSSVQPTYSMLAGKIQSSSQFQQSRSPPNQSQFQHQQPGQQMAMQLPTPQQMQFQHQQPGQQMPMQLPTPKLPNSNNPTQNLPTGHHVRDQFESGIFSKDVPSYSKPKD